MLRNLMGIIALSVLAACSTLPRGAGLQQEVLARSINTDGSEAPLQFAVEPVTRENLVTFLRWPATDSSHYHWIDRVDQPNTRIIEAGDTLRVTIWGTEENGLLIPPGQRFVTLPDLRVSPGGSVFLPYIGDQRVRGMSPERARSVIEEKYLAVTPSAQVQLELTEGRQRTVSLIGGVASPGSYPLPDNDFTILQLLADGGGITNGLNNPQIRLHRDGRIFGTSADLLLETPGMDTTLQGGDKIFVEEDDRTFLSLGAAGTEAIHPFPTANVSALDALSIVGGLSDERANAKGILILRTYPTHLVTADRSGPDHPRTVFTIDLTSADGLFSAGQFYIEPGDLIYVTESPVVGARSVLALLGSVLGIVN